MAQQNQEDNIRELADAANKSILQQQEKSAALAAKRPKPSMVKQVFITVLLLAFAVVVLVQYPRFHEPFGRPDPNQDKTVAEADLTVIALMIQSYKVSQGKLPATLDEVRLPDSLAAFVVEQKIAYRLTDRAYTLDWNLPRWHVLFDGETGKIDVVPVKGGK
jgi:hypothetical protein